MVELLAPAGNFISLRAVLENGADAVYFGLDDYNMRANAKNFSLDDLSEVAGIAKEYGAKTYLCTNIILNERLASELDANLESISSSEMSGDFARVLVTDSNEYDLVGEIYHEEEEE